MRKSKLLIALVLLLPASTAMAQGLVISKDDMQPTITGTLGGNATSFSRTITIGVSGNLDQPKVLKFRKFDLREVGGTGVIERSNISFPTVTFTKDQPQQDVTITVNNVTRFGRFQKGPNDEPALKIWLPEQSETDATVIDLIVNISPKIDVKVPAAVTTQLIRCSSLTCSGTGWLPATLLGNQRWLLVDNQTPIAAKISGYNVVLQGQKTGRLLTNSDVQLTPPQDSNLPARQQTSLLMGFNRDQLLPDRYAGSIRFDIAGSDVQPTVNFTLDVREHPWWALVALLFGVILGRLVKSMNTPEALLQVKLIGRVYRIQRDIDSLRDPADRNSLGNRLAAIRKRINKANETEQVLTVELEKIEAEIRFLNELYSLRDEIDKHPNPAIKPALLVKLAAAKKALLDGRIEECVKLLKEVSNELRTTADQTSDQIANASLVRLIESVDALSQEGENVRTAHKAEAKPQPAGIKKVLSFLAGASLIGAEVRYWLVRPVFFILLLIFLVLIGLKTLYIDQGTNFGSEGLYSYLGLVLWGMTSDVMQRTLQNLELPRAS